jgi:hypothetical protein
MVGDTAKVWHYENHAPVDAVVTHDLEGETVIAGLPCRYLNRYSNWSGPPRRPPVTCYSGRDGRPGGCSLWISDLPSGILRTRSYAEYNALRSTRTYLNYDEMAANRNASSSR